MPNILEWIRAKQETVERWVIVAVAIGMLAFGILDNFTDVLH